MNLQQEIIKMRKDKLASFFYDLAKLIFGATVVGGLTPFVLGTAESVNWLALVFGGSSTALCAWLANRVLKL